MDARTPKTAIVYYSLQGHSERLANRLAEALHGTAILADFFAQLHPRTATAAAE